MANNSAAISHRTQTFAEYLDAKNKLQNVKVAKISDYDGPKDAKPMKEKMPKNAGGAGQKGTPKDYSPTAAAKNPNKAEKGFADKGDAELVYKPKVGGDVTTKKTWSSVKEWLDATADLPMAEFMKSVRAEPTSKAAEVVREMKRAGEFDELVAEMLRHDEAFAALARLMDERTSRRLVRALDEMVAPPAHEDDLEDDAEDIKNKPLGNRDAADPDEGTEDAGEEEEELGDEDEMDAEDAPEEGDTGDDDMSNKPMLPALKKNKLPHDNLMRALRGSPAVGV